MESDAAADDELREKLATICREHLPIGEVIAESPEDVEKSSIMTTMINHEVNKIIYRMVDDKLLPLFRAREIEAIERYTEWLTDNDPALYLKYHHDEIKRIEERG